MTTLPATIPGLVRFCTPLWFCDEVTQWVALNYGPATNGSPDFFMVTAVPKSIFGLAITTDPSDWAVDLTDPTGFQHALLWLGAKYGAKPEQSLSFHAASDPSSRWSYPIWTLYADGYPIASVYDAEPCHPGFGPAAILIKGSRNKGRVESLRLAVLAVAGVQP